MKFSASIKTLLAAIKSVSRAIPARPTHPILLNVLLVAEGETITLTGYDLSLGISCKVSATEIKTEGSITLPAKIFSELLAGLPEGNITLEVKEDGNASFVHLATEKKAKYKIPAVAAGEYPELPEVGSKAIGFSISVKQITEAIDIAIIAAAEDETKQNLCGVNLSIVGGALKVAATDGHRLALSKIEDFNPDIEVDTTIPANCLQELSRIAKEKKEGDILIKVDEGFIEVEIGESKIVSRLIGGDYPIYQRLIPEKFSRTIIVNRSELGGSLQRIALFTQAKNRTVKILVDNNELTLMSCTQDSEGLESLSCELTGERLETAFNIDYLIEGLRILKSDAIKISMNAPLQPTIIEPYESEGENEALYLTMPVQLKKD